MISEVEVSVLIERYLTRDERRRLATARAADLRACAHLHYLGWVAVSNHLEDGLPILGNAGSKVPRNAQETGQNGAAHRQLALPLNTPSLDDL